jgi:hypothetical protein
METRPSHVRLQFTEFRLGQVEWDDYFKRQERRCR